MQQIIQCGKYKKNKKTEQIFFLQFRLLHLNPRPLSSAAASFSSTEALQVGSVQGHKELVTEVQFLGVVNHPNLVKFIGYCAMDGERGIQRLLVYEYMPNKSLDNHLMGPEVADYAREDSEVIYRDFKASNMLLDTEFNPKLLHFGLSREGPTAGHTHVSTTPQASVVFRKSMRWWEKSLHPNMVKIDSAQDFGGSFVECW